ncbi:uncharacterized protein LOC134834575 [Culicoides brevitarsis]|uniref:uncharacterized protein LOC134834575 n=1 Tax=Culicoides brevitarsis TaxID=469753 RepID=UPI00307C2527
MSEAAATIGIEDFPTEVIIHIFKFLNPADRIEASLVCTKWFEIFSLSSFVNQFYINFFNCSLSKFEPPASTFMNALRTYSGLNLSDIYSVDEDIDEFWATFGTSVTDLVIKNCTCITGVRFQRMLRHFVNLKTLKLYGQQLVMGLKMNSLQSLDLTECNLDKDDAEKMICELPVLQKLRLNWDTIIDIENVPRNAVQGHTIQFLERLSAKKEMLKLDLFLPVPFFGHEILLALSNLANLRLNHFVLKTSGDVPTEVFQKFFETQSSIEILELQNSRALTQETLAIVTKYLTNLKEIVLPNGTPYFETPLEIIQGIDSIESVSINVHFEVDEERRACLTKQLMRQKLRELRLPNIHTRICNESLLKVVKSFPDLQSLDLSSSRISDDGLQLLFHGLPYLRELILDKCTEITDDGMTGCRNPLYAVSNMRGLRKLSLSTCKKLSDISVMQFKLPELVYLNLRNLDRVTELGIDVITTYCRALEDLNLANCTEINARCIVLLDENLHRLRCIDVSGCKKATEQLKTSFAARRRKVQVIMSGFYYPLGMDEFC